MLFLSNELSFPPVSKANEYGILAIGGDLSPERLKLAYENGIFPWFNEGDPITWFSPDPRMVLFPEKLKISKSMHQVLKKEEFSVTFNQNFKEVISCCKHVERKDDFGTWITDDMQKSYVKFHELGMAKSFEVWQNEELVGGLYGVDLGNIFCGESMFSKVSNASKVAFITMVQYYQEKRYKLIDCQVYNDHLASLGAEEIPRDEFMNYLRG